MSWADKVLTAFTQVPLDPGQTATVSITVPVVDCSVVDARGRRVVEAGDFLLPSSRAETLSNIPFQVID